MTEYTHSLLALNRCDCRIQTLKKITGSLPGSSQLIRTQNERATRQKDKLIVEDQGYLEKMRRYEILKEIENKKLERYNQQIKNSPKQEHYLKLKREMDDCVKIIRTSDRLWEELSSRREEVAEKIRVISDEIDDRNIKLAKELSALNEENATVFQELEALEKQRAFLYEKVNRSRLKQYDKLLSLGITPAVSEITSNKCSGCHLSFPQRYFQETLENKRSVHCPNCHRILIIPQIEE